MIAACRRRRRLLAAAVVAVAASALAVLALGVATGAGQGAQVAGAAQPELGLPVNPVALMGAAPAEVSGEVFGYGAPSGIPALVDGRPVPDPAAPSPVVIVRRSDDSGTWQVVQQPLDQHGAPLAGFQPAARGNGPASRFALAGQVTAGGTGALAGTDQSGGSSSQTLLVRDPGGRFLEAPPPQPTGGATNAVLAPGEQLFSDTQLAYTPVDDGGGHAGVLLAPVPPSGSPETAVLHYTGGVWTRESIQLPAGWSDLRPLAVAATGTDNAWLLAASSNAPGGLALFVRGTAGTPTWTQRSLGGLPAGVQVGPRPHGGQQLTVTTQGIWIDAVATSGQQTYDLTMFVKPTSGQVAASWCDAPSACTYPLGSALAGDEYRSFAWASGGDFGTRVVTGGPHGVTLRLRGSEFDRVLGIGGNGFGTTDGAAFVAPDDGWISSNGIYEGVTRITPSLRGDALQRWPVAFRHPLSAVAPEPGAPVAGPESSALAVGDSGTVARYKPGQGWVPEYLYGSSGARATPRLRGVAWPEPGFAYAVGDLGEMWLWRADTGLWEHDPGKPINFLGNLTGVAFDPADPTRGYAIGKEGVILRYDKSWTREPPPAGLENATFTSITFSGSQAIAAYRMPAPTLGSQETGGIALNDGSGWRIDDGAAALLQSAGLNRPGGGTYAPIEQVAGLPDGGAVAAGPGFVIERDSAGAGWRLSAQPLAQASDIAAVAAVRSGATVRAVVSSDANDVPRNVYPVDNPTPSPAGHPPPRVGPDPYPTSGYVLRETASGWRDEQHSAYPLLVAPGSHDLPAHADSVLALLLSSDGAHGWAVGGESGALARSGSSSPRIQTAGVARYPAEGTPAGTSAAPLAGVGGQANFAVGGNAACVSACADLANDRVGPDQWLPHALSEATQFAGQAGGPRMFLYTGARVAGPHAAPDARVFAREEARYGQLMGTAGLPVYAATAPSDVDPGGSLAEFDQAFAGFNAPFGGGAPPAGVAPVSRSPDAGSGTPGGYYYSFDSSGAGGTVRVIVVDYSQPSLGSGQQCWLAQQLSDARAAGLPALVMGNRGVDTAADPQGAASDAASVADTLVSGAAPGGCAIGTPGGASAYLYDAAGENRAYTLRAASGSIPVFGSGTLGYTQPQLPSATEYYGASGFLLASLDLAHRDPATGRAPASARLEPNISELALDAVDGVFLRRSHAALFQGLARRPPGGLAQADNFYTPDPYVPIPELCQGTGCASFVAPSYSFSSSRPDIGDFVKRDPTSTDPRAILLGKDDKPIHDSSSGVFCAYNAGTTTVSISTGGLVYSEAVTIQPGSAERPCGTVPLVNPPPAAVSVSVAPAPAPAPPPSGPPLQNGATPLAPPPAPVAPIPVAPPPPARQPAPTPPARPGLPLAGPVLARPSVFAPLPIVPPPPPPVPQPTPPAGTSTVPVSEPVTSPEERKEEELAEETQSAMSAYHPSDHESLPPYLLGFLVIAALAGVSLARGRGGGRRAVVRAAAAESSIRR